MTSKPFLNSGTPGRIRTCDPRIRSPILYPAELLVRNERVYNPLGMIGQGYFAPGLRNRAMFVAGPGRGNLVPCTKAVN